MSEQLDLIIFGASGYSGKRVVQTLHRILTKEKQKLNWGIAGRCIEKLRNVLVEVEQQTGQKLDQIAVIQADTNDEQSLLQMASKTRLVINCTGPYKYHGEQIVRACIQKKCHCIDITGEPQFMERIQLLYDEEAAKNGVYIVSSCGLDSIPADIGLDFLRKQFKGTINSVDCYQEVLTDNFGYGPSLNSGTWKSILQVLYDYDELRRIRSQLFKTELPQLEPKLTIRRLPHKVPFSKNLAGPYPGCEATVMRRSQRYFYETSRSRPIQVHTYFASVKYWHYFLLVVGFMFMRLLTKCSYATEFLAKHSKSVTLGFFGTEPDEDDTGNFRFVTTFRGRGWRDRIVDASYREREDGWMVVKVSGDDLYAITAICSVVCGLVLLDGSQNLPERGGVYTPASIFTGTDLVGRLQKNGIEFKVCGEGSI